MAHPAPRTEETAVTRLVRFVAAALTLTFAAACSSNTPTTPTPSQSASTSTAPPPPAPAPIPPANLQSQGSISISCFTGLCTQASVTVRNTGTGCATNTQATVRFYGGDGAGPQLGIDVPMVLASGSLSSYVFYPGSSTILINAINFNDVRSAHTVYRLGLTWRDIACP